MFRTINKDGTDNAVFIQGAQSKSPGSNIASIVFQNYDDDSKITYNMGSIAIRDHFGNNNQDGYGDLIFLTRNSATDPKALTEQIRLTYNGNVGLGTSTPQAKLHVDGSLYVAGSIVAPCLTITNRPIQKTTPLYNSAFTYTSVTPDIFTTIKAFPRQDTQVVDALQCTAYVTSGTYAIRLFNVSQNTVLGTSPTLSNTNTPQSIVIHILSDNSPLSGDILEFQVSASTTGETVYIDNLSVSWI